MKNGAFLELEITDINNLGCGIGRADGKVVFIKGAVTGDRVRAQLIKDNKNYSVARLDSILRASAHREKNVFCSAALSCGGCVYRHITYEYEKQIKYNHVKAAFDKAGLCDVCVLPVLSADKEYAYRNKAQYPVCNAKGGMRSGFYASKTHNIVPVETCSIQNPIFADITDFICRYCDKNGIKAYDEKSGTGLLRHIYLRIAEATGEIMLCLVVNGSSLPNERELILKINKRFERVVSILINENRDNTNVVLGKKYRLLWGKEYIEDTLCGLNFRISPESFYQVNREGAQLLYGLAKELAELDGTQTLADLYCGTGTIGLSMADKAKKLVGIEIVEGAVDCARLNAEYNGIENASFFCGDAGNAETIMNCTVGKRPDVVVIDPPRKGSTRELVECLAGLDVPRVVYVSCNPETLARDCVWFREYGYQIGKVQPVDMFPRTGHVESLVCLQRQTN